MTNTNQGILSKSNKIQITFDDFDKLNLKAFAENILQIMEKGSTSPIGDIGQKGSYPISLNALFGNGKTTFLKMFEHFIRTENQKSYDVLFINAWESDFYGEPVIAILSELANQLEQKNKQAQQAMQIQDHKQEQQVIQNQDHKQEQPQFLSQNTISQKSAQNNSNDYSQSSYSQEDRHSRRNGNPEKQSAILNTSDKIKEVVGILANYKITKFIGNIVNQIIQNQTGFNLKEAKDSYHSESSKNLQTESQNHWSVLGKNVLNEFHQRKQAIKKVKEIIVKYTKTNHKKLLIIVDELDRTRPDYAVHFLEDMKHFFDIENVVFLVAVNRQQMEATVKCLYGQSLNFDGYYSKFCKTEIDLPDPYKSAQSLIDNLIKKTNIKYNSGDRGYRVSNSYLSCKMFGLTLREVGQFIRIYEMILGDDQKMAKWMYQDAYSFFICIFMKEKEVFQKILAGKFTVENFVQFVDKSGVDYRLDRDKGYRVEGGATISENNIVYSNNVFLGQMACSFIKGGWYSQDEHAKQKQRDISLITQTFQVMNKSSIQSMFDPMNGFSGHGKPSAVTICETINQHKPAF